jgi:hypothetical protein
MQQRLAGTETKVADGTEDAPWGGSPEDGAPKQIAAEKCATEAESLAWGSMEIHGFGELSEYHLTALIKFCTAFDFRFTVRAETEPEENRQGLRLPPVGGVVVTLYQSEPA